MTAPLAALVTVLVVAGPAWAGMVQVQDDARVLNTTTVQQDAATQPIGVYIWTTTQDAASKPAFNTDVSNKISATFPVVIGVNTQATRVDPDRAHALDYPRARRWPRPHAQIRRSSPPWATAMTTPQRSAQHSTVRAKQIGGGKK